MPLRPGRFGPTARAAREGRLYVPQWHPPLARKFERRVDVNTSWAGDVVPIPLAAGCRRALVG